MSVRKSHLIGKNHIKYYCDYYEAKAKTTGKWKPNDLPYEIDVEYLTRGAPGGENKYRTLKEYIFGDFSLPPPPIINGMPHPPPAVLNRVEEQTQAYRKAQETQRE